MAQVFFKDKSKVFECNISVEGAMLSNTKARLRFEFDDDVNYIFNGKITEDGTCKVKVPAMKNTPFDTGIVTLEVISEETFFEPWSSDFNLKRSKNITVEVVEEEEEIEEKPKIRVETKIHTPYKDNISSDDKATIEEIMRSYTELSSDKKDIIKTIAESHKPSSTTKRMAKRLFKEVDDDIAKLYMYYSDMARNK